ncbi:MAG TPA: sigma-54 dependent transcriptional regulator [Candidatus Polarisedimenticolia bacterium]|nr:sigma-54 dependent transcriptional regulator [Candidatus Polarisedimenticolia bacterium]
MGGERILIVEDEKLLRWALRERLERDGYQVHEAATGGEGLKLVDDPGVDLVLLDHRLPDMTGLDVLRSMMTDHADVPVILVTAYSTLETAVEAIKLGAFDYVNKPFNQEELSVRIAKALESSRLQREVRSWRARQKERYGPSSILGTSEAVERACRMVEKIGRSSATTVLITGESGTGKDLVAKAIHYASHRAARPFMNITCTALPETLLESELMGHEMGSFTDARSAKQGLFELADGGTVFLDEIGDMGVALQSKLLRFLQEKTFRRVGGIRDIHVDVRVIAATNRDLDKAVAEGRFREDLYYRLKVIPVHLPPLRSRSEDIPILASHFIALFNREFKKRTRGLTDEAIRRLTQYPWPGNVRELRNVIERAMILENKELLSVEDLPSEILDAPKPGADGCPFHLPAGGYALESMEREMVRQALDQARGNQTRAARLLDISRDALRYKMKKFSFL